MIEFVQWWNSLKQPLSRAQRGYKTGAIDGWRACQIECNKENRMLRNYIIMNIDVLETTPPTEVKIINGVVTFVQEGD